MATHTYKYKLIGSPFVNNTQLYKLSRFPVSTLITVLVLYLIFHRLTVVSVSFFSLIKGITLKNLMLCFVLINSVFLTFYVFGSPYNLCWWFYLYNTGLYRYKQSLFCFQCVGYEYITETLIKINHTQVIVHFCTQHSTSWRSERKSVRKEAGIEFSMKPFVPLSLW